jgi:hypothetical protein
MPSFRSDHLWPSRRASWSCRVVQSDARGRRVAGFFALLFLAAAAICALVLQISAGMFAIIMATAAFLFFVLAMVWGALWALSGGAR